MKYAVLAKYAEDVPADMLSNLLSLHVHDEKMRLLRKGRKWMNLIIDQAQVGDDFVMALITYRVTGKLYKIPRILKRKI